MTGNKLIQEWDEWESLQEPDVDKNDVLKMDYRSECQELLKEIKEKRKLSNDQYFKILTFQASLTLYLDLKDVDIPELIQKLHDLRISCIMKEDSFKISTILNSISTRFSKIEKKSQIASPSPSKISNTQSNENMDNNDNFKNAFNFNVSFSSRKKPSSPYLKRPNPQSYKTENPFQFLANNEDTNEYESIRIPPANFQSFEKESSSTKNVEHSDKSYINDLFNLLSVNNGIVDPKYTQKIYEKICRIHNLNPKNKAWKNEYEYFRNRDMIPLQHIVYLRNLLTNDETF